mmetsp:Transcript_101380/g.175077  ORF Transcript_101380/g.175077 Transcript_101380/m.175077 type:complete len:163 (-) Transcript_101380:60-548(-)
MPRPSSAKVYPQPGQVLILLAGQHRGKRVVCLKELEHGVLLVTGPYKVNGVPLRRVNRRYVICTSTHIDISSIDVKVPSELFNKKKRLRANKTSKNKDKTEDKFFEEFEKSKKARTTLKKDIQKKIDGPLIKHLKALDPLLTKYLSSVFTLKSADKPHELKF